MCLPLDGKHVSPCCAAAPAAMWGCADAGFQARNAELAGDQARWQSSGGRHSVPPALARLRTIRHRRLDEVGSSADSASLARRGAGQARPKQASQEPSSFILGYSTFNFELLEILRPERRPVKSKSVFGVLENNFGLHPKYVWGHRRANVEKHKLF